jgi:hypothetical protein
MQTNVLTPIRELIDEALPANMQFKPTKDFYQEVGINKHRFSKILRGEIQPQRNELHAIAGHFHIPVHKLL